MFVVVFDYTHSVGSHVSGVVFVSSLANILDALCAFCNPNFVLAKSVISGPPRDRRLGVGLWLSIPGFDPKPIRRGFLVEKKKNCNWTFFVTSPKMQILYHATKIQPVYLLSTSLFTKFHMAWHNLLDITVLLPALQFSLLSVIPPMNLEPFFYHWR